MDESSNIEDTAEILNIQHELYSSTNSTSDTFGAMAKWSLIESGTDNNPLESTVHNSSGTERDLKGHLDLSKFNRTYLEELEPCDGNDISGNSIPIFDLTLFANTEVINSQCPFEDAEKSKSTLSQENDNLGTYDEPDGFSDFRT